MTLKRQLHTHNRTYKHTHTHTVTHTHEPLAKNGGAINDYAAKRHILLPKNHMLKI